GIHDWRKSIGYVPQETFLLNDTVRANLLWANPDASEDNLQEALRLAAADFLAELPTGLDTVIGDRGVRLSGGQRQRLALARALVRHPSLLVLDEATSALDAENQAQVHSAIEQLPGAMTVVIIAHRLSTVRHADQIVVLKNGKVVETGTFHGLTSRAGGRFQELVSAEGGSTDIGTDSLRRSA
ncbi:MAG: ATP-binding cassette domain-containing protein, partial [Planctomycetales bacterium]